MVLQTIQNEIQNLKSDNTTFSEYYMRYVLEIQDDSLQREISYMIRNKICDVNLVDREIIHSLESYAILNLLVIKHFQI